MRAVTMETEEQRSTFMIYSRRDRIVWRVALCWSSIVNDINITLSDSFLKHFFHIAWITYYVSHLPFSPWWWRFGGIGGVQKGGTSLEDENYHHLYHRCCCRNCDSSLHRHVLARNSLDNEKNFLPMREWYLFTVHSEKGSLLQDKTPH